MNTFFGAQELIFALVLKVGFAASLAALLVRFRSFRNLLFTEIRDSDQKVMLLLFLTPPLAIGVFLRLLGGYRFFDLTLEGSFLMGLIGGRVVGLLGGSLISLPAFGNHEWLSSPIAALAGLIGGSGSRNHAGKRGYLAFRAVSFSQRAGVDLEIDSLPQGKLGDVAVVCVRGRDGGGN